jgi:hypothetical protein
VLVKEHSEGCAIVPRDAMYEKLPAYWRGLLVEDFAKGFGTMREYKHT